MGFKDKMAEGIEATGKFTFSEVNNAAVAAANAMGEKAMRVSSANEDQNNIWLEFYSTGAENLNKSFIQFAAEAAKKKKYAELMACVVLEPANDGTASITVGIAEANTTQQTVMFIPVTPKSVHGLKAYREFLDHFAPELKQIDPDATVTRR